MDINDVFGQAIEVVEEPVFKEPAISPFDFINAITFNKTDLIVDDWSEKQYVPYIINKGLSYGADTVIPANEMNSRAHLDKKLQFQFLINNIRPRKRFNKWIKVEKIESIEVIKNTMAIAQKKHAKFYPFSINLKLTT